MTGFLLYFCSISAESIEDALSISPRNEATLFANRDKFDLVAIYDDSSDSMKDPPLSILFSAIYENAFRKILRNMPLLLIGGLQAWKREYGDTEVMKAGSSSPGRPSPLSNLVNGVGSSSINGTSGTPPSEPKGLPLGHVRAPAESSVASMSVAAPVPFQPTTDLASMSALGRSRSGTESSIDPNAHRPWIPTTVRSPSEPTAPGSPR